MGRSEIDKKLRLQFKMLIDRCHRDDIKYLSNEEQYYSLVTQYKALVHYMSAKGLMIDQTDLWESTDKILEHSTDYKTAIVALRGVIRGLQSAYEDGVIRWDLGKNPTDQQTNS